MPSSSAGPLAPDVVGETKASYSLEEVQRQHILRVLERTGWVISGPRGAGAILDLHPNTLRSFVNRLGIRRRFKLLRRPRHSRYFASDGKAARVVHEIASATHLYVLRVSLLKCLCLRFDSARARVEALLESCVPSLEVKIELPAGADT